MMQKSEIEFLESMYENMFGKGDLNGLKCMVHIKDLKSE